MTVGGSKKASMAVRGGSRARDARLLAALLLLSALIVRGALTAASKPAATKPNLILFSIDDHIQESSWRAAYRQTIEASGARNPNGCRIPLTWFTASGIRGRKTGECAVALRARRRGHELATHTKTHLKGGDRYSYSQWRKEVEDQRKWLVACGVPRKEVAGFRAPYFAINEALGTVLRDLSFRYDSSLAHREASQPPYELSAQAGGPAGGCSASAGYCGNWSSLAGVWEVPTYVLPGKGGGAGRRVDPQPVPGMTVLQRLKADFERKRGTGVPTSVMVHEPYLADSKTRKPVVDFFKWAMRQPNTWVVTYQQAIAYQQGNRTIEEAVAGWPCDR